MAALYIGLMSGTSLDGVDAVLVDFADSKLKVLGHCSAPFPDALKAELLALNSPTDHELHRASLAGNAIAQCYAAQVKALLTQSQLKPGDIRAIGAHGQTVRHRPQEFDGIGYTLQLNQPALLAELCGIDVVADFRSRDVAAGGQGAPLVPPFHHAFFSRSGQTRAVLNIGGISNLSLLGLDVQSSGGFDCGPGNALIDAWCLQHIGHTFDNQGRWAATGQVNTALLIDMQADPYFTKRPPKSTGRDLFNPAWLSAKLSAHPQVSPVDVQSTLTELSAWACSDSLQQWSPECRLLIVCGGGALNLELMRRLQRGLPDCQVESSEQHGLPPLQVEAAAFAWLAKQAVERRPGSLTRVTGARGARILGAIYPA